MMCPGARVLRRLNMLANPDWEGTLEKLHQGTNTVTLSDGLIPLSSVMYY